MSTTSNGPGAASPTGEGWNPLADRIAGQSRDFLDGVAALARGEGGDQTVPLLLLEVSQILLAGAQLGASKDVILPDNWEPDVGADPDLDVLRTGLARRLADVRRVRRAVRPVQRHPADPFRLSDDLAAVAADLIHGLQHYEAGRSLEALWWWQYSYVNHWGTHGARRAAGAARGTRARHARRGRGDQPGLRSCQPPEPPVPAVNTRRRALTGGRYTQAASSPSGRSGPTVALVVQKYGGSSVADADGIKRVAQRIVATRKGGRLRRRRRLGHGRHHRRTASTWPTRSARCRRAASWTCC